MTQSAPAESARPEVTLVMSLYNCVELTKACLASLLATLPPNLVWELIIVDDFSTDGTRAWLATLKDPRIRVLLMPSNGGYGHANNIAVKEARAPFLVLINNDLVFTPGWLEPMLAIAQGRTDAGIVGNLQYKVSSGALDHAGIEVNLQGKPVHTRTVERFAPRVLRVPAVTGACMVLRTALWEALGGFDEQFRNGAEDVDLCFKASAAGLSNYVATRSRIFHHVSPSPGRKARDEENSCKLTQKWRGHLVRVGAVGWSRRFLEKQLNARWAFEEPFEMLHLVAYSFGWTRFPPVTAVRAMELEVERQLEFWALTLPR